MASEWKILAYDEDGQSRRNSTEQRVQLNMPLLVGREGDLPLGVDCERPDPGVSRRALIVTATAEGWQIEVTNGRGAWQHPWGLAPIRAKQHEVMNWPRIGIRILGGVEGLRHWVLLETHPLTVPAGDTRPPSAVTDIANPPKPLTPAMEQALRTVFGPQLQWPPSLDNPLQIKQAASRLQVSEAAVQQRLQGAQQRALRLGLPREVELTQPDYLHVLVEAGYLALQPSPDQNGPR